MTNVWVVTETTGSESMDSDGNIDVIDRVSVSNDQWCQSFHRRGITSIHRDPD